MRVWVRAAARWVTARSPRLGLPRRAAGRHARPPVPGRTTATVTAASVTAVLAAGVAATSLWPAGHDHHRSGPAAVAVSDPPVLPVSHTADEWIFLAEWSAAGIALDDDQADKVVRIGREHISHGHLVGMRELIRADLRAGIPRLDDDQIETGLMLIEHHFQRVTGRKQ